MEVSDNISFISERAALEKGLSGKLKASAFHVYLGYCGWGPRQLENEARHEMWYIFNQNAELAFDEHPSTLWSRLVEKAEGLIARFGFFESGAVAATVLRHQSVGLAPARVNRMFGLDTDKVKQCSPGRLE